MSTQPNISQSIATDLAFLELSTTIVGDGIRHDIIYPERPDLHHDVAKG